MAMSAAATLREQVRRGPDGARTAIQDVRVDHGRRHVTMTEQFLDGPDVVPYLLAVPRLVQCRDVLQTGGMRVRPASARDQVPGQRDRAGVRDRPARRLGEVRRRLHAGQLRRFDQRIEERRDARPALGA